MICQNCGYEFSKTQNNFCPNCKMDALIFNKLVDISDSLYNLALKQCKKRELSNAITNLEKCLVYNRSNCDARNLLGLVYLEIGEIGDALKQWVISSSMKKENNLASIYINTVQEESGKLEKFDDAVKMYNESLEYLKQDSYDMAIISLKKAIELSTNFVKAINILALCALKEGDTQRAITLIDRVLSIDNKNETALKYYNEITNNRPVSETNVKISPNNNLDQFQNQLPKYQRAEPPTKKHFGETFHLTELLAVIVGGAIAIILFYIFVLPSSVKAKDAEITALKDSITTITTEKNAEITELNSQITTLTNVNSELKAENDSIQNQISINEKKAKLEQANSYLDSNNYIEAATIILTLDTTGLEDEEITLANTIKEETYLNAGKELFDEGYPLFNDDKNADAKVLFEKALLFAPKDSTYIDDIIYCLGAIAEAADDKASAKKYYETIVSDYPNSNQLTKTNTALERIAE